MSRVSGSQEERIAELELALAAKDAEIEGLRADYESAVRAHSAEQDYAVRQQQRAEAAAATLEAAKLDTERLDWLGYCCHGFVRGTDISKWTLEAPSEGIRTLRAAIDAARESGKEPA